jgi:hypothetical protein
MIMVQASIREYISPRVDYADIGFAEFACLLEMALAEIGATPDTASAGQVVEVLNGRSQAAITVRSRFGLDDIWIFCDKIGFAPDDPVEPGKFLEALRQMARHEKARAGEDLMTRIEQSKAALTRLWPVAFDALATSGTIGEAEAYELGIGASVYAIMLEQLGIEPGGRMSRDDFLEISPRLILFWPLTEAGLQSLLGLIREAKSAITAFIDRPRPLREGTLIAFRPSAPR